MTKHYPHLAILADIHGILPSLQAVLGDLQSNPPDEIIVAGDFLGGPQPMKTMNLLHEMDCRFVVGNGESNMLTMRRGSAPQEWWTHHQFDMGVWIYHMLDNDIFPFLESLPEHLVVHPEGCDPLRVVHGAPWDINKLVYPHKEPEVLARALRMIPEDILVFAHNHLPEILLREGKLALNPGSVSNNLNGDVRASYATLTWDGAMWQPKLHYVTYDLEAVKTIFKDTGFLDANRPLSRGFLESILTGDNTAMDFILFAFKKAREAGYKEITAVPDDIWLASEGLFPWAYEL